MKKWIRFAPVLAWMGVIFWFSAQDGASSGRQSEQIVRWLAGVGIAGPSVELLVRKAAHMAEYAVLCALAHYALSPAPGGLRRFLLCVSFCACYALTDEFHQLFVGGRGASIVDVAIDTAGAAIGGGLCTLGACLRKRRPRKRDRVSGGKRT